MVESFQAIAEEEGAIRFDWAEREEDRRALWKARHEAYWAVRSTWPGKDTLATDVCVPISRLAECVMETKRDIEEHGLIAPIVGHVGDGNFHTSPVFDPADEGEKRKIEEFLSRLSRRAIDMEGTCTGEHGVGQGKIKYLQAEHGAGLDVMRQIKTALDPNDIFNPGKILPL
jgi:D-lactate dehydrogenase (cytochrome)